MTENYKRGKKKLLFFFGQNRIFDSVLKCINAAISQKYNKLDQVRTAENFNHSRDWRTYQEMWSTYQEFGLATQFSPVPVLPCLSSPHSPLQSVVSQLNRH